MNMSTSMSQKKKVDMINKVKSTIILCRNNKVLREFANQEKIVILMWVKFESLYE